MADPAAADDWRAALELTWRAHAGRLHAGLVARFQRLDLAEDAVAEALSRAAARWPADGVPDNPAGWLATVAARWAQDRLRAEAMHRRKLPVLVEQERERWRPAAFPRADPPDNSAADVGDERLRLLLLCTHPALAPEAAAALSLRLVAGVSTAELARLFHVPEPTLAARLTRAKKKIVHAGIPFAVPVADRLSARLDDVLRVAYLAFTAGYAPGDGADVTRVELAGEAIRLVRVLDDELPGRRAVRLLLALMLLQHARRDARTGPDGELVLLPDQDRTRWRHDEITEALGLLTGPAAGSPETDGQLADEYEMQALIAAVHATAPSAEATDWTAIARLYDALERLTGSAVVRLNRAVAVAEAHGPAAGLALLDGLDETLRGHRLPAVRAELLTRDGRLDESAAAYRRALDLAPDGPERRQLQRRFELLAGLAAQDVGVEPSG